MLDSSDWSKADLGSSELDARVDQRFDRLTLGNESAQAFGHLGAMILANQARP